MLDSNICIYVYNNLDHTQTSNYDLTEPTKEDENMHRNHLIIGLAFILAASTFASPLPEQTTPTAYRLLIGLSADEQICGLALQGLVAKAVNQGRSDELLAIQERDPLSKEWIQRTEDRLNLEQRPALTFTDALEKYRPLIKGYILYKPDASQGAPYHLREGMDHSANIATMLAGPLQALPVPEELESRFQGMGFQRLEDARSISYEQALQEYAHAFNRSVTCSLDPRYYHLRDLVVAHNIPICYGLKQIEQVTELMDPPFAVLGWGAGDEFKHVEPFTKKGGYETASNWARNLSFLSAGATDYQPKKISALDPHTIDWNDARRTVSFMLSDGDNTGWMLGNFWSEPYYGSEQTGNIPMGFSAALSVMAQMAPVVVDRFAETKPDNIPLIEANGGYYYPDLFAIDCPNREEILRKNARNLNQQMKKTGAHLLCFLVQDSASEGAQEAYRIFAQELEPLYGMLVIDYAPYHKGLGKIYWAKNRDGIEIPAITANFSMWQGMNRLNAGDPLQLAEYINSDTTDNSWVAVHAWSRFPRPDGSEAGGTDAIADCIQKIDVDKINVVSPEEMIWRIRMAHNRKQTVAFLKKTFK
jgi:hypothetical protein